MHLNVVVTQEFITIDYRQKKYFEEVLKYKVLKLTQRSDRSGVKFIFIVGVIMYENLKKQIGHCGLRRVLNS